MVTQGLHILILIQGWILGWWWWGGHAFVFTVAIQRDSVMMKQS